LDEPGAPPADFSLRDYASRSFGIYQDEVQDIVLRITGEGVDDALRWRFHPNQEVEQQPDGSVLVRLRASGMLELAWHLFTWGDKLEVLQPQRLKDVFDAPDEAVRRVRAAFALGRKPRQQMARVEPATATKTILEVTSDLRLSMAKARAVQLATQEVRKVIFTEQIAIDSTLKRALSKLELADYRDTLSPEGRRHLDETWRKLDSALGEPEEALTMEVAAIAPPPLHPHPAIHEEIQATYSNLLKDRSRYLASVRDRLKADRRLADLVKANLAEIGCAATWEALAEA
jgi:hypothetical protein